MPHRPVPRSCSSSARRARIARHRINRKFCVGGATDPVTAGMNLAPPPSIQSVLLEQQQQQQLGNGEQVEGPGSGKLRPADYTKFVQFFRHASPYIAGHRGRTFVIVIPGNVSRVAGCVAHVGCCTLYCVHCVLVSKRELVDHM